MESQPTYKKFPSEMTLQKISLLWIKHVHLKVDLADRKNWECIPAVFLANDQGSLAETMLQMTTKYQRMLSGIKVAFLLIFHQIECNFKIKYQWPNVDLKELVLRIFKRKQQFL